MTKVIGFVECILMIVILIALMCILVNMIFNAQQYELMDMGSYDDVKNYISYQTHMMHAANNDGVFDFCKNYFYATQDELRILL